MNIEFLREFLILSQYQNISAAAEHLYITQPVLSRHISFLESHFGVELIVRHSRGITLTDAGALLAERAQALLSQYDGLREELALKTQGYDVSLCIGVPYYAINDYLGPAPRYFDRDHPNIKLTYVASDPNTILDALMQDKADVTLVPHLPFPFSNRLVFHDLYRERLGVLINRGHPLAGRGIVSLADLRDETFLNVSASYFSTTWEQVRLLCQQAGFEPRGPILFNQMESVLIAIQQNMGVSVIGRHMRSVPNPEITFLELSDSKCTRKVSLCYKKGNTHPGIPLFEKVLEGIGPAGWE